MTRLDQFETNLNALIEAANNRLAKTINENPGPVFAHSEDAAIAAVELDVLTGVQETVGNLVSAGLGDDQIMRGMKQSFDALFA